MIKTDTDLNKHDVVIALQSQQLWLPSSDEPWRLLRYDEVQAYQLDISQFIEVAPFNGGVCYVAEITGEVLPEALIGFRALMGEIDADIALLINRALQLSTWRQQHQFCGQCGKKTTSHQQDLALSCEPCALSFYPKIMPCIMCLIVKGDYCLLAHHARHKEDMYATLAGFVEAGESLEATLRREVKEEVGLSVGKLEYFKSQPWPYPQQLMIGFFAEYESGEICEDGFEILDAQWFHYSDLPKIPSINSLSGMMIAEFVRLRAGQD